MPPTPSPSPNRIPNKKSATNQIGWPLGRVLAPLAKLLLILCANRRSQVPSQPAKDGLCIRPGMPALEIGRNFRSSDEVDQSKSSRAVFRGAKRAMYSLCPSSSAEAVMALPTSRKSTPGPQTWPWACPDQLKIVEAHKVHAICHWSSTNKLRHLEQLLFVPLFMAC